MTVKKFLYGALGFLSLLGIIGLVSDEKFFLCFFASVLDFEYWFVKSDEMLEEYINKSAARGFFCGMATMGCATVFDFFVNSSSEMDALIMGLTLGWAVALLVYSISTAYFGFKERWGMEKEETP